MKKSRSPSLGSTRKKKVSFAKNLTKDKNETVYEFGGPLGALGVMLGLPLLIYALFFVSSRLDAGFDVLSFEDVSSSATLWQTLEKLASSYWECSSKYMWSSAALKMVVFWICFQVFLERVLPGEKVVGVSPHCLPYVMSGHLQFWVTLFSLLFGGVTIRQAVSGNFYFIESIGALSLGALYDEYIGLMTYSIIFSTLLSIYLYARSFKEGAELAAGGNSGNVVYDLFIGRELNPRILGNLDLKEFCELRPGLIGWAVLNLGMAFKQYELQGKVSFSMVLIVLYQGLYVWDALFNERAILTTMDITTDGFGFMLAFGDLAWVPFIYSLQARYLVADDPWLSVPELVLISLVHFGGMYIFRAANSEKDSFRRDPSSPENAHLQYMETERGTRLLVSGWWGMARKINYTGDFFITLAWCMLCGYRSPVPYFQAIYFAALLIHRADRDDHMCHEKYGDDWLEYKKKVPYLFIPYVW